MTGQAPVATYGTRPQPVQAPPAPPSARPRYAGPVRPRRRTARSLLGGDTPGMLRSLMVTLILGAIIWGVVAAWTVDQHASGASEVVTTSEPLSLTAQQMYQSLSDADVTATTAFLAGPPEPLSVRQHYEADIASAAADLAELRSAGAGASGSELASDLGAISAGLPVYTGYVQQAQTYSSLGYPLTGGSFMQVASEEMHLTLLPAAHSVYASENAGLTTASSQATGLPLIVVAVLLAIGIGLVLVRAQRWLTRRTHRTVNYGLILATAALVIATGWLAVAFVSARSDFGKGLGHGSTPAEAVAQASIAAQQARSDEVLNLISRSGSASFQDNFAVEQLRIGPGVGTFLNAAATASPGGTSSAAIAAAGTDAKAWYAASKKIFELDTAANYAAETKLVIGTGAGGSAAAFAKLESDLSRAISADQVVFTSNAANGSGAFGGLEAGVIIAAVLMAAGSAWGLSRRLAEYR